MLPLLLSTAVAAPDPSLGVFAGAHVAGAEHELYSAPGTAHGPLGPSVPLGLRLGLRLTQGIDLEGEAFAGPATGVGGGFLYGFRGQFLFHIQTVSNTWKPLLVAGFGNLGIKSKSLGADLDMAGHLGPAVAFPVADNLAIRADARWLISARKGRGRGIGSHGELLLTLQWRKGAPSDRDGDGVPDSLDLCPRVPEFEKNGWKDDDGCPDQLANLLIRVKDAEDRLLRDTEIHDGDTLIAITNRDGNVQLTGLMPDRVLKLTADTKEHEPSSKTVKLEEGDNLAIVVLGWAPGTVVVSASQRDGTPIAANVWALGAENRNFGLGSEGRAQYQLAPGPWTLMVASEGYDAVTKTVQLPERSGPRTHVDVTLFTQRVGLQGDEIVTLDEMLFDYDTHEVLGESLGIIDAVALTLRNNPDIQLLEVAGHASGEGTRAYNMNLSQRRVEEVVRLLTERGVDRDRLDPHGYGELHPRASNARAEGRKVNRRVEFLVRVRVQ